MTKMQMDAEVNLAPDDGEGEEAEIRLEIEGPDAAVRALAKELGVAEAHFIAESYIALWLSAREKDPSLPEDMLFEDGRR